MLLTLAVILTCLTLTVILTDTARFMIPNWLVALLLLLYPVLLFLAPQLPDWKMALLIGGVTFGIGFLLFNFNLMGGGDVKLLAVLAVFAGKEGIAPFIMGVGLLGGVLALGLLLLRPIATFAFSKLKNPPPIPRVLTIGEPVPYGVAIAIAFLLIVWQGEVPGLKL
jgi:prepilin peptidase CpaA